MNFYYSKDGQSFGPLPLELLINIIDQDTLVWNEDGSMPDWQPAATVPAIVSLLTPSTPSNVIPPVPKISLEPEEELSDEMKDLLEMEAMEEQEHIAATQSVAPIAEHGIPIKLIFKGGLLVMGTIPIKVLVDGVLVGESTINRGISLDFRVNSTRPRIKVDTTILDLPDLIIDKSYEIHVKYGQISGGFFEPRYGILPKPTSIIAK
jgi:hypothetical protein